MPLTILTDIAETLIAQAAGDGSAVAITHIALGDGRGAAYNPAHSQTELRRELARRPILTRHMVGRNAWRVSTEFLAADTPTIAVREIGFLDAQGRLIALWAGSDVTPRQTGAIDYLVEHVLSFSRVAEGLVIVDAPDDAAFDLAVATATAIANLQAEQLRQADRIRAISGAY